MTPEEEGGVFSATPASDGLSFADIPRDDACVYLIEDTTSRRCYIGATLDPAHRLRQHNRELVGGAQRTARGTWRFVVIVHGLETWRHALQLEWAFKRRCTRTRGWSRAKRLEALTWVLAQTRWTRQAPLRTDLKSLWVEHLLPRAPEAVGDDHKRASKARPARR